MSAPGSAIVTGGTSGIGLAAARVLASQGYDVYLWARGSQRGEAVAKQLNSEQLPGKVKFQSCDVSSADSIQEAVRAFSASNDSLEILINAAGILQRNSLGEYQPELVSHQIDIVLKGTVLTTSALAHFLAKSGKGVIVNIGSVAGQHSFSGLSAYGAAKAAIAHFTRTAAQELYSSGIRVLCVCPGVVKTGLMSETEYAALQQTTPGRRLQQPEEIGQFIVELTSASYPSLTGAVIDIDDGVGLFQNNRPTTPIVRTAKTEKTSQKTHCCVSPKPTAVTRDYARNGDLTTNDAPAVGGQNLNGDAKKPANFNNPVLARVAGVFHETFGIDESEVDLDTSPEDVARWDSLGNLRLIASLEKEFQCSLDVNEIMEMIDVASIVEVMKSK